MPEMPVAPKKLDVADMVEIGGRHYEIVPDKHGGLTLEPAITVTVPSSIAVTVRGPRPRRRSTASSTCFP